MPVPTSRYKDLAKDFIGYKLRKSNIFIEGYNQDLSTETSRHLRRIADELIDDNRDLFGSMCDQLHLTPTTTYPTFVGIADEIFQTGKNWGRIVAFFAFGATLAVYCARREELFNLIDDIVEWISRYMDQNLSEWVEENGGWDGFEEFFRSEDTPKGEGPGSGRGWGMAAVCGLGIGALLMLATRG